jgi:hypothetical protein
MARGAKFMTIPATRLNCRRLIAESKLIQAHAA